MMSVSQSESTRTSNYFNLPHYSPFRSFNDDWDAERQHSQRLAHDRHWRLDQLGVLRIPHHKSSVPFNLSFQADAAAWLRIACFFGRILVSTSSQTFENVEENFCEWLQQVLSIVKVSRNTKWFHVVLTEGWKCKLVTWKVFS